eukprot:TRINITY_DN45205_c0_g1_i1.p1 TRINITY_DN45205_c0_g1~~TRINITY_DN45205_c0_g1_i1.p1  ORF type:complete len:456 (-),score=74.30 TRINITY_DN45205_c0_g1_i1:183-1550(-)
MVSGGKLEHAPSPGQQPPSSAVLSGVVCLSTVLIATVHQALNSSVPDSYMDEVFHVPQTQRYCAGDFQHWDNMITTFPGLYLIAVPWSTMLACCGVSSPCGPAALRALNGILGVGTLIVLLRIVTRREASEGISKAVALWMFPPSFFCIFLFYTDTASLLLVLICYDYSTQQRDWLAGLAAVSAVAVRQTNVVWVTYVAGLRLLSCAPPQASVGSLIGHVLSPSTLAPVLPLLAVIAAFGVFLIANEGAVVIGDPSAHGFSFHGAQLLYFAALSMCAGFPSTITTISTSSHPSMITVCTLVLMTAVSLAVVSKGTIVHKYLLADNRHYAFYIWKNFFGRRWWSRYVFAPVYALGMYLTARGVYHTDRTAHNSLVKVLRTLGLLLAVSLVLIPSPLLEPRYFITPFVMVQLQAPSGGVGLTMAQVVLFGLVNAVTLYVFIARPFTGPDGAQARFMW